MKFSIVYMKISYTGILIFNKYFCYYSDEITLYK